MSPSEHDLRQALHAGEGDRPDVDRLVAGAAAARSQRRSRLLQVAAAVVLVVAGGGVTTALVTGDDGTPTTSADSAEGGARAQSRNGIAAGEPTPGQPRRPAPSAATDSSTADASTPPATAACPPSFPQRALPGGGTAQAGSGPLFARPAASITVCSYGAALRGETPAASTLTSTRASELQRSLENARTTPSGASCQDVRPVDRTNLAFVAVDADGAALRTVTTTLTTPVCDTRTTNGSAVRFAWVPPSDVRQLITLLSPGTPAARLPSRSPSGKIIGTPVR